LSEAAKILAVEDKPDFELLIKQRFPTAHPRRQPRLPLRPARRGGVVGVPRKADHRAVVLDINMR